MNSRDASDNSRMRISIGKYKIMSILIFIASYFIEWYRLPKECIIDLVAYVDNFPHIISRFDIKLSDLILSLSNPLITYSMVLVTIVGGLIPTFTLVIILYLNGYKRDALYTLFSLVIVVLITLYLKNLFHRPRPFQTGSLDWHHERDIEEKAWKLGYLIDCIGGYSFPSGHAARTAVYAGVTYYTKNKWFRYLLILSILVGLSRIYLTAHFFTDVLIGWLIGLITGYLLPMVFKRLSIQL